VGLLVVLLVTLGGLRPASAQVAVGDSLWRLGKTDEAAAAYRRAVELDQNSVRANFRLAQTLAWGNNTDSALVFLRNARARVPDDPDLRFAEATYLGWARRFDEALAQYDSILAQNPGPDFAYVRVAVARTLSWAGRLTEAEAGYREALEADPTLRDARFGLAQLRAWSGDLDGAMSGYRALEADDPTETRLLVAIAQVALWQGRSGTAAQTLARVQSADTALDDVAAVRRAVREARGFSVGLTTSFSQDRDENRNAWQTFTVQGIAGDATRITATAGYLGADDPHRSSNRMLGEFALSLPVGRGTFTAGVGVRDLDPAPLDPAAPRPEGRVAVTGRLGMSQRLAPGFTVGGAVARWPFDEIAALMVLELDVDQVDLTAEWRVAPKVTLSGGATRLGFSDGNVRLGYTGRLTWRLPSGFNVGAYGTAFGYDFKAPRYFSPHTFRAAEVNGGWGREASTWTAFLGGGFGGQKVADAAVQRQWHADGRLSRRLGDPWWVEASAGSSTSAAATAIGAYRYDVLTLGLRRRF
jgi:tetratricopeptide (TPR) repeat protein